MASHAVNRFRQSFTLLRGQLRRRLLSGPSSAEPDGGGPRLAQPSASLDGEQRGLAGDATSPAAGSRETRNREQQQSAVHAWEDEGGSTSVPTSAKMEPSVVADSEAGEVDGPNWPVEALAPTDEAPEGSATANKHVVLMAQYSIVHEGQSYRNDGFRYERLADALGYARLAPPRQPTEMTALVDMDALQPPSAIERHLMRSLAISFADGMYRFQGIRYQRFIDAANYASLLSMKKIPSA